MFLMGYVRKHCFVFCGAFALFIGSVPCGIASDNLDKQKYQWVIEEILAQLKELPNYHLS